jgi:HEAT repeat protein
LARQQKTFLELLPQLFLFPLLIVTVCVLVWLLFIASAQDNRSAEELVSDLQSGGSHGRKQDAYALALKARELSQDGQYFSADVTRQLLAFVARERQLAEDPEFLEFLVMAVGRAGDPAQSVPVMTGLALDPATPPQARIWAVRALGLSGASTAGSSLLLVLASHREAGDWEFRWNALAGLVNLRSPAAVEHLRRALQETRRELRWSAACWLAMTYSDGEGRSVLEDLTDWAFLDQQMGEDSNQLTLQQKEKYMMMALEGLVRLDGRGALPLLKAKREERRSPGVQDLVLRLIGNLEESEPASLAPRSVAPAFGIGSAPVRRSTLDLVA